MRKGEEEQGAKVLQYGKAALLGILTAFSAGFLFLLLAAAGVSAGLIAPELRYQLTVVACVFGSFAGGVLAVRQCSGRGLFVGLTVGGGLFLLILTVGVVFFEGVSFENGGLGLLCGALCGGAAAGILSGGGKRPPRRRGGKSRRSR